MILWAIRFFVFTLYESPKYLMGKGRDQEAVDVVHKVAQYNGVQSSLTIEELKNTEKGDGTASTTGEQPIGHQIGSVVRQHLSKFDSNHVYPLFATRKLAYSTSLLIILWGKLNIRLLNLTNHNTFIALIGLAFPL